jgi:hypothetical protein
VVVQEDSSAAAAIAMSASVAWFIKSPFGLLARDAVCIGVIYVWLFRACVVLRIARELSASDVNVANISADQGGEDLFAHFSAIQANSFTRRSAKQTLSRSMKLSDSD